MTATFFSQLSEYYYKENDLSNITCSMCKAMPWFMDTFVKFFFPDLDTSRISSMEREVPDEDDKHSRVDLLIRLKDDKDPYLIEVKIYDENHHFGQYEEAYHVSKDRLGYITNYVCYEGIDKGYDVKTWQDWYNHLNASLIDLGEEEQKLCIGYLAYLKKVCGFCNLTTSLDLDDEAEKNLIKQIHQVIDGNGLKYKGRVTRPLYEKGKHNVLTYLFSPDKNNTLGGWTGTITLGGKTFICVAFYISSYSVSLFEALKKYGLRKCEWFADMISTQYFSSPCMIIPMSESKHLEFLKCQSPQDQMAILAGFLNRMHDYLVEIVYKNEQE